MFGALIGLLTILVIIISIFTKQWGIGFLWLVSGGIAVPMLGDFGLFIISVVFLIILIKGLKRCEFCEKRMGAFSKKYEEKGHIFCKECIQTVDSEENV